MLSSLRWDDETFAVGTLAWMLGDVFEFGIAEIFWQPPYFGITTSANPAGGSGYAISKSASVRFKTDAT